MPTFVQSHLSTADNTVSVAYPTANTAGNLLVVAVRYGANPGTLSDSRGNTYTQILDWNDGGGYTRAWYAPNCAAGANTLTLSNKAAIWILLEYSDVQAATPLDASNTGATSLSVTTTAATDLLVMIGGNVGGSVAPGQTGSYTMRRTHYQSYGGTPQSLTAWDTVAGAAGSYSNTLTNSTRGVLAAFKAAVVAGIVISPTSGVQGDAVTVTVTGTATHFSSSSVVTVSGSGVAVVGAPIVASATSLTAVLGISSLATTGARTLTVTTGSEVVTAAFTVSALAALTQRGNVDFDQVKAVARHGDGVKFQMFGGGATVAGDVAVFDAGGNVIDGGTSGGSFMMMSGAPEPGQIPQWNEATQEWAPADISAGGDLAAKEVGVEQTVVGLRGTPIEDYKPDDRSLLEYDTAENQWCPTKVIAPDSAIFHKPDDIVFGPNWQNWNPVIQSAPGMPITNVVIAYAYYLRVGPVVFFSVGFNAEITGAQMQASFRVSLPVATVSSDFHACACYGAQDVNVSPTVCPGFISEDDLVIFGPEKGPHVIGKWRFGASGNYRCSDARTIEKPWRARD